MTTSRSRRPPSTRPAPVVVQAPDRQGTAILVAFGALVTLWLCAGPIDEWMRAEALLLPTLVGYDVGDQTAKAKGR